MSFSWKEDSKWYKYYVFQIHILGGGESISVKNFIQGFQKPEGRSS